VKEWGLSPECLRGEQASRPADRCPRPSNFVGGFAWGRDSPIVSPAASCISVGPASRAGACMYSPRVAGVTGGQRRCRRLPGWAPAFVTGRGTSTGRPAASCTTVAPAGLPTPPGGTLARPGPRPPNRRRMTPNLVHSFGAALEDAPGRPVRPCTSVGPEALL
jgi:hypothetical protein